MQRHEVGYREVARAFADARRYSLDINLRFLALVSASLLFTLSAPVRAQVPPAPMPPTPAYQGPPPGAVALGPVAAMAWEPETRLKSIPAVVGGSVLLAGGTAMHATGVFFLVETMGSACGQPPCGKNYALPWGLTLGGLVTIGGAVALVVWGAQKVPVRAGSVPAWVGAPGGAGWQWRF